MRLDSQPDSQPTKMADQIINRTEQDVKELGREMEEKKFALNYPGEGEGGYRNPYLGAGEVEGCQPAGYGEEKGPSICKQDDQDPRQIGGVFKHL